jgi:hypothetical protein
MTTQEQTFPQKLEELVSAFIGEERPDETDAETAAAILEFVFSYERLRRHVTAGTDEAKAVDAQTISKMRSWDSNDPTMSTLEKVIRRLAEGRGEDGVKLLKDAIQIRALALSKKQAEVAKHPRKSRQQPMSGLVEQILRQEPKITQHQLFLALKRMLTTMVDPPYSYSGSSFKSKDERFPNIPDKAIGQFLYRAKKKLPP